MSLWDETGSGLNFDTEDHDRVRCARCGFPCVLSRDIHFPWGSYAGWGIKYVRLFKDTTIASVEVEELYIGPSGPATPTVPAGAITTEDGIEITTEDGQTIIVE